MRYKIKLMGIVLFVLFLVTVFSLIVNNGITGAVTKQISCNNNIDCNDRSISTTDLCRNPGTEYSLCVNLPIK